MSTVYFIRHGQASFGSDNYDTLNETGTRRARPLAAFLDEQPSLQKHADRLPDDRRSSQIIFEMVMMASFNEYPHLEQTGDRSPATYR